MKIILYFLFLLAISFKSFGQEVIKITLQDTIHLRGFVSYPDGTPLKNFSVKSTSYPQLINSLTDSNGYFELKPCLTFDTIIVGFNRFPINGSRFVTLTVPNDNFEFSSEIVGKRKNLKKKEDITFNLEILYQFGTTEVYLPSYPGGFDRLKKTLNSNIKYPEKAIENNISGEVVIKFTVDEKGYMVNPVIIRGIGYDCDKEVKNAILKCEKWNPGIRLRSTYQQDYFFHYFFKLVD